MLTAKFGSIRPTNMATKINSFFWLANVKKIFSSESRKFYCSYFWNSDIVI